MQDYITQADVPQGPPVLQWLTPRPQALQNYSTCPWAKTIIAIDPETDDKIACPVTCKRWGCLHCARKKIRKLAFLTNGAKPNRMITLTVDPKLHESPKAAWEKTSPAVPELCKVIRKNYGECEYLRVTELHQSGWPHYHCLVRSSYIPQRELSDEWAKLTGAIKTDIRKVSDSFSSFRYLVKYLTKLHRIEWTERHVSYSRGFFNPCDLEKILFPERQVIERVNVHPWKYVADRYPDEQIGLDSQGNYIIPQRPAIPVIDHSSMELGLDDLRRAPPPPKLTQQRLLAEDDQPRDTWTDDSF